MKVFLILFILQSLSDFPLLVDAKKKKKAKKSTMDKLSSRPEFVSESLYCESCMAILEVSTKNLYGKKSEHDVFFVLSNICNIENFIPFKPPPMELKDGCDAFL